MVRQMETNAEWTVHPAPAGTLLGVPGRAPDPRAAGPAHGGSRSLRRTSTCANSGRRAAATGFLHPPRSSVEQRAYLVFQLAQVRGWSPAELIRLSKAEWARLVDEIESFGGFDRRRDLPPGLRTALSATRRFNAADRAPELERWIGDRRRGRGPVPPSRPSTASTSGRSRFAATWRRSTPTCETFGVAGFFGVAMYYRGVAEAHFRPLCPVVIRPTHCVREEPLALVRGTPAGSRSGPPLARPDLAPAPRRHRGRFVGGFLTGVLGSLGDDSRWSMRVLLPRLTARIEAVLGRIVDAAADAAHAGAEQARTPGPANGPARLHRSTR